MSEKEILFSRCHPQLSPSIVDGAFGCFYFISNTKLLYKRRQEMNTHYPLSYTIKYVEQHDSLFNIFKLFMIISWCYES